MRTGVDLKGYGFTPLSEVRCDEVFVISVNPGMGAVLFAGQKTCKGKVDEAYAHSDARTANAARKKLADSEALHHAVVSVRRLERVAGEWRVGDV